MSGGLKTKRSAIRLERAHQAVDAIALIAVVVVQGDWDVSTNAAIPKTPSALVPIAILTATAWLLSTMWIHAAISWHRNRLTLAPIRIALQAIGDLLVSGLAAAVLHAGHQSPFAHAGLWTLAPALLAVSLPSAIVLAAAPFFSPSPYASPPRFGLDLLRLAITALLLIVLCLLQFQPHLFALSVSPS